MSQNYRLIALPGEGIGQEVVTASLTILQKIAQIHNFSVQIDYGLIGKPALEKLGSYCPQSTLELCTGADGILFGDITQGGILELRKHFDFLINFRPVRIYPSLLHKSSLKPETISHVDILFVRELVSGIYFGASGLGSDNQSDYAYPTMYYYDYEIRKIARIALEKAGQRRRLLTVAHKENALQHLHWTKLVKEEARQFPHITLEPMLVDNLVMQLVINPQHFDVVLASNLFGDILSDLGGALTGTIGLLGSSSLNNNGFGLYEAVHGTIQTSTGIRIANPLGTIASVIMLLEQWGENEAAKKLQAAQERILDKGYRTLDLNPQDNEILVNTEELVQLFLKEL